MIERLRGCWMICMGGVWGNLVTCSRYLTFLLMSSSRAVSNDVFTLHFAISRCSSDASECLGCIWPCTPNGRKFCLAVHAPGYSEGVGSFPSSPSLSSRASMSFMTSLVKMLSSSISRASFSISSLPISDKASSSSSSFRGSVPSALALSSLTLSPSLSILSALAMFSARLAASYTTFCPLPMPSSVPSAPIPEPSPFQPWLNTSKLSSTSQFRSSLSGRNVRARPWPGLG